MAKPASRSAEWKRLAEDTERTRYWKRWGPYLSEQQWGTVREDYSPDRTCWDYFPHDHARNRAYRWGEDGLLGVCDRRCRLCFALALWNERNPILKEQLFGLSGPEGNHGEDVKECYFFISTSSKTGWTAIRPSHLRPLPDGRAGTATGSLFTTATSFRCRTSGNSPGTRSGTWPST